MTIAHEQLGHASVSTTLNIYTHVVDASLISWIRRECPDHVIVTNEVGSRRVFASYFTYYSGRAHGSAIVTVNLSVVETRTPPPTITML